jgi:hypothetical protein
MRLCSVVLNHQVPELRAPREKFSGVCDPSQIVSGEAMAALISFASIAEALLTQLRRSSLIALMMLTARTSN